MSTPKYLKKNKCSFKPTSTVKAMLVELETLINLLNKPTSVEDFINEALQAHLPTIIEIFRGELSNKNNLKKLINDLEYKINNLLINKNLDENFDELKEYIKQNKNSGNDTNFSEKDNENDESKINSEEIMNRFLL